MSTALARRAKNRRWYALGAGLLSAISLCASTVTASAAASGPFTIINRHSGLCLSVPGDNIVPGQVVNQYTCGGFPDQRWIWEPSNSNPDGWFYLQPQQNTSLCVTYPNWSYDQLVLQYCGPNALSGADDQIWYYHWNSGEFSALEDGYAMSVPGAATGVAPVNTYPYGPYPDQDWDVRS